MRRWLVPGAIGLVAFLVGVGVGVAGSDTSEIEAQLATSEDDLAAAEKEARNKAFDYESAVGQYADLEDTVSELQEEIRDLKGERSELQAELVEAKSELRKAKRRASQGSGGGGGGGSAATFGDGVHRVGTDIQPGTYRSSGGDCYWARLRNFGGGLNSIIANGLSDGGPVVVTIDPSDAGFESTRCGTWTAV
jgi:TolA-binding protein